MALKFLSLAKLATFLSKFKGTYCGYGVCSTAAGTTAKTVTITDFKLVTGARAFIKWTNKNTAATPTLEISGTGAKEMRFQGGRITNEAPTLQANTIYIFIYTGTYYELVGNIASGAGF